MSAASAVDVVVVSYNSRDQLRACVEPLARAPDAHVIVVDNASPDGSLEVVRDLPVTAIQLLERTAASRTGVNAGWRAGSAPYVLLLNPDARIEAASLRALVPACSTRSPRVGAVAPRIVHDDGVARLLAAPVPSPAVDVRAGALPAPRLPAARRGRTSSSATRTPTRGAGRPDWVSGACVLVRREALDELDGLDEGFFMYSEDIDLCRRLRSAGYELVFEPAAVVDARGRRVGAARGAPAGPRGQPGSLREEAPRTARRVPRAGRSRPRGGDACARRPRRTCRAGRARAGAASPWRSRSATSHPARAEPPL